MGIEPERQEIKEGKRLEPSLARELHAIGDHLWATAVAEDENLPCLLMEAKHSMILRTFLRLFLKGTLKNQISRLRIIVSEHRGLKEGGFQLFCQTNQRQPPIL